MSKGELKLALLQTDIIWEDIDANFSALDRLITGIDTPVDLILLPETFTTGFTMNVLENVDSEGRTISWMQKMARKTSSAVSGTVIVKEGSLYFNRHYLVQTDETVHHYDKRHLFRISRERDFFSPGTKRVIVKLGEFRILLQTCFDLRFPVFSRVQDDYDAIVYAANWPAVRHQVWEILLRARAIENQAYVIGVNRSAGKDGEGLEYLGGSCVIHPLGMIEGSMEGDAGILIQTIKLNEVTSLREKFPVSEGADTFTIEGLS